MDTRSKLVALAVFFFCGLSQAAYMSVTPGPAFTPAANTGEKMLYKATVSDYVRGGMVRTGEAGILNLFQAEKVPGAMKYATSAARVAARFAFGNPLLFIATGVAVAGYEYYKTGGFELCTVASGTGWCRRSTGVVCGAGSTCYKYRAGSALPYVPSVADACQAVVNVYYMCGRQITSVISSSGQGTANASCTWGTPGAPCVVGLTSAVTPPYDTTTISPADGQQMEDAMAPTTMPDVLPKILPVPLPIENPYLFPEPDPSPLVSPQVIPKSVPQRFPLSDPVPANPPTVPQTWKSPVIDVTPSPTVDNPWRVDTQPKDIVSNDPTPIAPTAPAPAAPASGTTEAPKADKSDLCLDHPEIIACQIFKPDTVEPTTIPNENKNISISKDTGWGPSNGACPAPKVITVQGKTLSFSLSMLCDFASAIRPLFLALAWISSIMLMLGIGKKG